MKFSVLLPTRNRLDLLSSAVETVRRQDYDDWEIIVSDNFSDEDVHGYVQSLEDHRIKYYRTERFVSVTDNWNNALDKSVGDYIIMLGDDDCLMNGYFSTLSRLIKKFESPDFIYTSAFLYAYPGVIPSMPAGFLRIYSNRKIYQSASRTFWLERTKAMEFVKNSLDFRVAFDFNMQFFLVSRKLIEEMKPYGQFYQSPYPDYYASNAIMLKAKRILIVPQPLVTIGITPKSFGFYYYNDAEKEGHEFLNSLSDQSIIKRLQKVILPGKIMNTSWLISMEMLSANFVAEFGIKVNYVRYRLIQILGVYAGLLSGNNAGGKAYKELREKMSLGEWLRFGILLSMIVRIIPKRYHAYISNHVAAASGSHPGVIMPIVDGEFNTILDVFGQVDPKSFLN